MAPAHPHPTPKGKPMSFLDSLTPAACAARNVPNNPQPLCRDFTPQPAPAEFWCETCHWNEPMHASEAQRAAIAEALADWAAAVDPNVQPTP